MYKNLATNPFAGIALVSADASHWALAQTWCEQALVPEAASNALAQHARYYAAFNSTRLAVVTQLAESAPNSALTAPAVPAGVALQQELGKLTYEKLQAGATDALDSPLLYSVRFVVPDQWIDEFDRWYEEEHLAMIYGSPHWAMTRRYRLMAEKPGEPTHLALHYLSDARGFDAPQLREARTTPWRKKFLGERWFTDVDKTVYFRQTPATPSRESPQAPRNTAAAAV